MKLIKRWVLTQQLVQDGVVVSERSAIVHTPGRHLKASTLNKVLRQGWSETSAARATLSRLAKDDPILREFFTTRDVLSDEALIDAIVALSLDSAEKAMLIGKLIKHLSSEELDRLTEGS